MRHEPESLTRLLLKRLLEEHWGLKVTELAYAPLGFGSHHWTATIEDGSRRFVTADHLIGVSTQDGDSPDEHFEGLRAAFTTARLLRDAGLEFVLPPERTMDGGVIARAGDDWSVAVFPFVDAAPLGPGPWDGVAAAAEAARLVGHLHRATPPAALRRWSAAIQHRDVMEEALHDPERLWHTGPFGEEARALLARYRPTLLRCLEQYDRLAAHVLALPDAWVVTHGEPHSANFLRAASGDILLIDWDTVRLAPRERDLELGEGHAFEAYRGVANPPPLRPEVQELFRLRWSLADISVYVRLFRDTHDGTEDEAESWQHLNDELRRLPGA